MGAGFLSKISSDNEILGLGVKISQAPTIKKIFKIALGLMVIFSGIFFIFLGFVFNSENVLKINSVWKDILDYFQKGFSIFSNSTIPEDTYSYFSQLDLMGTIFLQIGYFTAIIGIVFFISSVFKFKKIQSKVILVFLVITIITILILVMNFV